MNLILTAGKAARMGNLSPDGCKALTVFRGRPTIEWQLDVLGEAVIVCRSDHVSRLSEYGRSFATDEMGGPAGALRAALAEPADDPVTVVYADSYFEELPTESEWCGTGRGYGGRSWDLVGDPVRYRHVEAWASANVCVGLYRFADPQRLTDVLNGLAGGGELGMPAVLSQYHLPFIPVPSWVDLGTPEALAAA